MFKGHREADGVLRRGDPRDPGRGRLRPRRAPWAQMRGGRLQVGADLPPTGFSDVAPFSSALKLSNGILGKLLMNWVI